MFKSNTSVIAMMFILYASMIVVAQSESLLVLRVEENIRNNEPSWRYIRGIQSGRAPAVPSERTLVASVWERRLRDGKRKSVSLNIYEVESPSQASLWLRPIGEGKIAEGWRAAPFEIGDEGYLSRFQSGRRYSLYFRKSNIVVEAAGESANDVRRFAQYVVNQITATSRANSLLQTVDRMRADNRLDFVKLEVRGTLLNEGPHYYIKTHDSIFREENLVVKLQRGEDKNRLLDRWLERLQGKTVIANGFLDSRLVGKEARVLYIQLSSESQITAVEEK